MTRSEMVKRLVNEGLSTKTLVNFSDNQLRSLCDRMLNEALVKQVKVYSMSNPSDAAEINTIINDPKKVTDISKQGHIQVTKETEMKEGKKKPTQKQLSALDKNKNKRIDKEDFKLLRNKKDVKEELKGNRKKLDVAEPKGKLTSADFKKLGSKKSEVKEGRKLGQRAKLAMTLKKLKENHEISEWVNNLAETNYHPFTSKGEIMELLQRKLNETETMIPMPKKAKKGHKGHNGIPEFMTYDSITSTETAPTKEPSTKPTPTKDPGEKTPPRKDPRKDPFRKDDPNPIPNPGPRAGSTIKEGKKKK